MMNDAINKSSWLEEEQFATVQKDIVAKTLEVYDKNVTLGDKNRIKKYREVLQSRIKEKGLSFEIRNWKGRCEYEKREGEKKLKDVQNELKQMETKITEMKKENQEQQEVIKQREKQIARLETDINLEMRKAKSIEQACEERINSFKKTDDQDKKKLESYSDEIMKKERELGELRGKVNALDNTIKTMDKNLAEKESENKKLQEANTQLQIQVNNKENQINNLESTVRRLHEEISTLKQQLVEKDNVESTLRAKKDDWEKLKNQLEEREKKIRQLESELAVREATYSDPDYDLRPRILPPITQASQELTTYQNDGGTTFTIRSDNELEKIGQAVEVIIIASNCCNNVTEFVLTGYRQLKSVQVGDECFSRVQKVSLENLPSLTEIKVGMNSFTKKMNGWEDNKSRHFHIVSCLRLESITIGQYSFSDYGGEFELKNLPELLSITIGVFDKESWNFSNSSFILRDLPKLNSVILGDKTFGFSTHTVFESVEMTPINI